MTYLDDLYTQYTELNEKARKLSREAWIGVVGGPILIIAAFIVGQWIVGVLGAAALAWGLYDAVQAGYLSEEIEELEAKIEYAEDDSDDDVPAPPRATSTTSAAPRSAASSFDDYSEKEGF